MDRLPIRSSFAGTQFAKIDRGELLLPYFLRREKVRILIVVDGQPGAFLNVSFNQSYFGLSAVLDTLRNEADYFVEFDVKRAHRQTDSFKPAAGSPDFAKYAPHYENFRFAGPGKPADFDINQYDQVWFFGARTAGDDLTTAELEVIARWMDEKKGGVFATGDHEQLGRALCQNIPRVRTMRKWTSAQGVPLGFGINRHDTLGRGHNTKYSFDDESDDIPMNLDVTRYPVWSWTPFVRQSAPHPLLCGKTGVINVFPDHPHEGEIIEENQIVLNGTINFGNYTGKPEYPSVGGVQVKPQVIAHARVNGDHTEGRFGMSGTDQNKGAANAKRFGCVGAYNGHEANVGRVAVDSTWHHWFDVNLIGRHYSDDGNFVDTADASKHVGFDFSTAGSEAYSQIRAYFRNMALWLSSPEKQASLLWRATWGYVIRYPALERLDLEMPLWELGETARDAIGRRAGKCLLSHWVIDVVQIPREILTRPDPCLSCPPVDLFELYSLGGMVREMLQLYYKLEEGKEKFSEVAVARSAEIGLKAGLSESVQFVTESLDRGPRMVEGLRSTLSLRQGSGFVAKEYEKE